MGSRVWKMALIGFVLQKKHLPTPAMRPACEQVGRWGICPGRVIRIAWIYAEDTHGKTRADGRASTIIGSERLVVEWKEVQLNAGSGVICISLRLW